MGLLTFEWDGDPTGRVNFLSTAITSSRLHQISDTPLDLNTLTRFEYSPEPLPGGTAIEERGDGNQYLTRTHPVSGGVIGPDYVCSVTKEFTLSYGTIPKGLYVLGEISGTDYCTEWVSLVEFMVDESELPKPEEPEEPDEPEESTAPIGFIEYLTNPKYHIINLFYDIIGWKLAQGGGGGADGEPALVSSDGYTLQDVNGLNLIPKEGK